MLFRSAGGARGEIAGREFLVFDVGGVIGIIGLVVMLLHAVTRHTMELYNAERLP